jgi:hypothetical protein
MTCTHFAKGRVLFREGDPADGVFRLLRGSVDILRELDGDPILIGTVGAGQFIVSSDRTICHGACLLSVASSIMSSARE